MTADQEAIRNTWLDTLEKVLARRNEVFKTITRGGNVSVPQIFMLQARNFSEMRKSKQAVLMPVTLEQIVQDLRLDDDHALVHEVRENGRAFIMAMAPRWVLSEEFRRALGKTGWASEESIERLYAQQTQAKADPRLHVSGEMSLSDYITSLAQQCYPIKNCTQGFRAIRKSAYSELPAPEQRRYDESVSLTANKVREKMGLQTVFSRIKAKGRVHLNDPKYLGSLFAALQCTREEIATAQEIYEQELQRKGSRAI